MDFKALTKSVFDEGSHHHAMCAFNNLKKTFQLNAMMDVSVTARKHISLISGFFFWCLRLCEQDLCKEIG